MRFPTMWYVRPAKPQISLCICAVCSEPLLVATIFYNCLATDRTAFGAPTWAASARLSLHLSKCHIVGNHMPRLNIFLCKRWHCIDVCAGAGADSPSQIHVSDLIFENRWYVPTGVQTQYLPYQLI